MTRHHSSLRIVFVALASVLLAAPAFAQEQAASLKTAPPTPAVTSDSTVTSTPAAAGPTLESSRVGVARQRADAPSAPMARSAGYGQPFALMVVGGAAVLAGLIVGGDAGHAIAIGGAVVGLIGLYQYLQ